MLPGPPYARCPASGQYSLAGLAQIGICDNGIWWVREGRDKARCFRPGIVGDNLISIVVSIFCHCGGHSGITVLMAAKSW